LDSKIVEAEIDLNHHGHGIEAFFVSLLLASILVTGKHRFG
jgi:hypothetical protein